MDFEILSMVADFQPRLCDVDDIPQPIPDRDDTFIEFVQWIGIPVVAIAVVVAIFRIADWIRFGQGVYVVSRTTIAYVQAFGGRGPRYNSRTDWEKRRRVLDAVQLPIVQISAVFAMYCAVRIPLSWETIFSDVEAGWGGLTVATLSWPSEEPPWTGWVAAGLLGAIAAYDVALVLRVKAASQVAVFVLSMFGMVAGFSAYGLGGFSVLALVFMGLNWLLDPASPWAPYYALAWLAPLLTAGLLGLSCGSIISTVETSPRTLNPKFNPNSVFRL